MKTYVIVRTRNEERNIVRFCKANAWADKILIADVGSEDDTVKLAQCYPNVKVRHFEERVYGENDLWRSPHGKHWNFLIDWAVEEGADWILHDDCDSVPTLDLQRMIRPFLEKTGSPFVYAYHIYIWGDHQYFPDLNKVGQSLYGFRADSGLRFSEENPWSTDLVERIPKEKITPLDYPDCLLHYFCPDEKEVERKATFYRESGQIPGYLHPLQSCGSLKEMESWMRWY